MITQEDLKEIALGYNWNKDMSYEEFVEANENLTKDNAYETYELINERYIIFVYE